MSELIIIHFKEKDKQIYEDLKADAEESGKSLSRVIISHLSYALNNYGPPELLCEKCNADLLKDYK